MAELPRGTGFLVAIAIGIGVVVAFFLSSGTSCDAATCGEVEEPQAVAPAVPVPTPGAPEGPASPAASAPGEPDDPQFITPGDPGGAADLRYRLDIRNPANPAGLPEDPTSQVGASLRSGGLTVSSGSPESGRAALRVDGLTGVASGSLAPLLVQDFRGSRDGWTLTASMSDFTTADGGRIGAENLTWKPRCTPHGPGPYPSVATAGSPTRLSRSALLCSAPPSTTVTGGVFDVEADFSLDTRGQPVASGSYTSTLLLTLT